MEYKVNSGIWGNMFGVPCIADVQKQAEYFHDYVLAEMDIMRSIADEIEINMPQDLYPIPTYSEIIYNV